MSAAKKGLGRGLSALFGDIENKSTSVEVQINKVPIANLKRNKYQPRTIFDEEKISELSSNSFFLCDLTKLILIPAGVSL